MDKYKEISDLYYMCANHHIGNEIDLQEFLKAVGGIINDNNTLAEQLLDKINTINKQYITTAAYSEIKTFTEKIDSIKATGNVLNIYKELAAFKTNMAGISTNDVLEIYNYMYNLENATDDLIIDAKIKQLLLDKKRTENFIRDCIVNGFTSVEYDEDLIVDYLWDLSEYGLECENWITNANDLTVAVSKFIDSNKEELEDVFKKHNIVDNKVLNEQKLNAISNLYTDLYNTDLDTTCYSDAFYYTIGEILQGHTDYNLGKITGGENLL